MWERVPTIPYLVVIIVPVHVYLECGRGRNHRGGLDRWGLHSLIIPLHWQHTSTGKRPYGPAVVERV